MRLKYYLRGLGIGIICTAIIMGIALSGNKKETLTDAEIIERARLLGMVMPEESSDSDEGENISDGTDEKQEGEQSPVSKLDEDENEPKDTTDSSTDKENDDINKDKGTEVQNEPKQQGNQPKDTADASTGELIDIEVLSGDYSSTVSQKLFAAGLIDNAESFNNYMVQKGIDATLHVGVYQIPKGATQDEIIDIFRNNSEE